VNFDGVAGWLSVVEVGVVELSWAAGALDAKRASGETWHGPCTYNSDQHHEFRYQVGALGSEMLKENQ
jgi:hypothetical protein